jgi:hypothetical protein
MPPLIFYLLEAAGDENRFSKRRLVGDLKICGVLIQ